MSHGRIMMRHAHDRLNDGDMNGIFQMLLIFFFNDTATTEIYTLSLHDALPICLRAPQDVVVAAAAADAAAAVVVDVVDVGVGGHGRSEEHTSELQSPVPISYAVFCLKKKT